MCKHTFILIAATAITSVANADDVPQDVPAKRDQDALFKKFEKTMSGATLVGHYTMQGNEDAGLKEERYTISSVTKLDEGDYWLFKARIKYGDHDMTVPLPLQVKWADDTPVITLKDLAIPGLGTFSSRVVIHDNKYAGTWRHGTAGGHLFGKIERPE